ncbi:hypothetical protein NYE67_10845 [Solibacillus sp. FSL W8-0474]|uniref:hypothetical protein n=1 Tax=Solibacillus sp. FSL W8-0474 TaxID=2975336 RepID=UPI0030F8EF81
MLEPIKDMYVYEYTFLDDLSFIKPIEKYFDLDTKEVYISELKQLFSEHGWEGDGDLGVIWFPPFVGVGIEDTYGHYVFHVKQSNNGTSFLASSQPLPFARLLSQNDFDFTKSFMNREIDGQNNYIEEEINIVQDSTEFLKEALLLYKTSIENELQAIETISDTKLKEELKEKVLGYNQNMIVQHLNEFLDDCYLNVLREVLNDGNNSNLKLKRSSVKIDLSRLSNDDESVRGDSWLTIHMIINDIWHSYRFESFKEKLEKLMKPLEYTINQETKREILKHVTIRNCIQHHNWRLDASSVKSNMGTDFIEILSNSKSTIRIEKWKTIKLTETELANFITQLIVLTENFNNYVSGRISTRYTRKNKVNK